MGGGAGTCYLTQHGKHVISSLFKFFSPEVEGQHSEWKVLITAAWHVHATFSHTASHPYSVHVLPAEVFLHISELMPRLVTKGSQSSDRQHVLDAWPLLTPQPAPRILQHESHRYHGWSRTNAVERLEYDQIRTLVILVIRVVIRPVICWKKYSNPSNLLEKEIDYV